ncbi:PH, RCC1 and FYVE domains-containing protein 1-like [Abrus precatorius]|uniref:PH, RCC1 and FYVE domains-containing protein 1-like n=1 Tax=Abrus precatorius TaxID=3816 RepID=A0A8B8MCJ2_ABRPR|nr:PH, RCC1 and FYVE domains-containing protein 1-like [Abrus precatorius]
MADLDSYGSNERDVEQAFLSLKKGTQLVKYSRKGKPKFCSFRLSPDETKLIWISRGREKNLNLSFVSHIIPGQRTAVFRRYLRPEKDYLSFSLIFKKGERSLDLICKDQAEVEVWFSGLKALISTGERSRRGRSNFTDDSVHFVPNDRPSAGSLELASSIARGRFSVDSVPRESTSSWPRSDVGSERANMPLRTSVGEGSRVSVSSISHSSSVGSGLDDIESLGDVYIWGEVWADGNSSDGLGSQVPSKTDVLSPKPLESDVVLDVQQIGPGVRHIALVTRQGEVFTWGEDSGGRLGHGFDKDFGQPHLVESLAVTNVSFVACGEYHTCALSMSGDLFTWGDGTNNIGLLGHGTDVSHCIPKRINGPLEGLQVVSVACGALHSALATSNGKLFTFGDGRFGVLGHGDRESVSYPKEVQLLSGQKAIKVACGVWHTAAILEVMDPSGSNASNRRLFTWGDGDQYRLGHVNKDTYLQPTCVVALAEYNFNQVACGYTMTVALTVSGHVFTMGSTAYGQLGNPMSDGKVPILVRDKLVGEFVEEISCGAHHVAVLTSRSDLYTWGKGTNGRLGHGDTDDQQTPTLVEAFRDRHVKNISCGSSFTSCICLHKWVSGADQSFCSDCRQPFGFTRKRHNCYNCGLVYCHPCSSKKALKAALAPTPSKPHRVCDACYAKLKGSDNASNFNREISHPSSSIYGREKFDRGEVRSSRILLPPTTEPVKYLEIRTNKPGSIHDTSSIVRAAQVPTRLQLKDVAFPSSLSSAQNIYKSVIQPIQPPTSPATATSSRPMSPYAKRPPSPPRCSSPGFSRSLIDSLRKKNDLLNQEVSKLQNHIRSIKQKGDMQDMKIQELHKNVEKTTSLAGEESSKLREAKEFIKSMTDKLREVTEKLPPEIAENETLISMRAQAEEFLNEKTDIESSSSSPSLESEQQSATDIPASDSDSSKLKEQGLEANDDASGIVPSTYGGNILEESNNESMPNNASVSSTGVPPTRSENSSRSNDSRIPARDGERSVIEQFDTGVYITLIVQPNGSKVFKRIRFSKRRFNEQQAAEWWSKNKDRVFSRYIPAATQNASTESSITPPAEDNVEALPS